MNTMNNTVILKPDKDPTLSSYHPLSLINTDIKNLSKASSSRKESFTYWSNRLYQRNHAYNTGILINIIQHVNQYNKEKTIASLDAEKAFERVNWAFLFATLYKFGLDGLKHCITHPK